MAVEMMSKTRSYISKSALATGAVKGALHINFR